MTEIFSTTSKNTVNLALLKQVVDVIGFCFKMGVDHRGLNEENIMYNPSGNQIKLIDFGSALVLSKHFSRLV